MMKSKVIFSVLLVAIFSNSGESKTAKTCCPRNEQFTLCGSRCEPKCNPIYAAITELYHCPSGCHVGCTCRRGYVRHPNGSCVKVSQCPSSVKPTATTTAEPSSSADGI